MTRILAYTSPARGHVYPLVPTLDELGSRGHEISVRTMSSEVDSLRRRGHAAAPIDRAIERRTIDDWRAKTQPGALLAACRTFADRGRHEIGDLRQAIAAGAPPLHHVSELATRAPLVVALTAEPFEYARRWPDHVRLVGPGTWEPAGAPVTGADPAGDDGRPLVLVTCSTEFQDDRRIVATALEALADEPVRLVATTGSIDPASFSPPDNAVVARYLPHGPLLRRAACVVCHGGMGITQKALAAGVPVCVVPFGRDQNEVARHVVASGAGTRLVPRRLSAERLRRATREAIGRRAAAERIADAFRAAGGPSAAADSIEQLVAASSPGPRQKVEPDHLA